MLRHFITWLLIISTAFFGLFLSFKYLKPHLNSLSQSTETLQTKTLTLKGSNTIGESFAPQLAKAYLRSIGATLIEVKPMESPVEKIVEGTLLNDNLKIKIDIRAHGSSTGFKALSANDTEIAMSSRAIKGKEHKQLSEQYSLVEEHPIALDALAIVTNPENTIDSLTIDQIAKLFSGEFTNWKQVGGKDLPVSLFSRDNNSGTWDTFKNLVLKPQKLKLSEAAKRYESSSELVDNVNKNLGAIGFIGVAHVGDAKLLKVSRDAKIEGKKPSEYTIGTQAYPLSRKLYFYTTGKKQSELAQSFINFVTGNIGQKEADDVGLVSYYPTYNRPTNLAKDMPNRYRDLSSIGRRLTVNFNSKEELTNIAKEERDLNRLSNFNKHNKGKTVVLVDSGNSKRTEKIKSILEESSIEVLDILKVSHKSLDSSIIEVWVL